MPVKGRTSARGNKAARNDFVDILAEAKNLMRHLRPCLQSMPKIDRIDGVGSDMRNAVSGIIRHYHMAYRCQSSRVEHIEEMIGWYGVLQSSFELGILEGVIRKEFQFPIAERMEAIERGVMSWLRSQSARREERSQCTVTDNPFGATASENSE